MTRATTPRDEAVRAAIVALEDFIDQPPSYESERMVRDYRHELYPKWSKLRDLLLASAPDPAGGGVDAVEGLSRADICRLWQWAAVNKPSSMTVEGFTNFLLNEIDGRSDPAKVRSITTQYLDILQFADNCLSSNGLFAQAKQLRHRIASLTPAATPVSEAGHSMGRGHVCEHGIRWPWACDDCDRAALAKPASPAGGEVREAEILNRAADIVENLPWHNAETIARRMRAAADDHKDIGHG